MDALSLISLKIQRTPGVCGGRACVGNTRIPVWTLISFLQQGATDEDVIQAYPALAVDHLNLVREYYETHRAEIDCDIREQGKEPEEPLTDEALVQVADARFTELDKTEARDAESNSRRGHDGTSQI